MTRLVFASLLSFALLVPAPAAAEPSPADRATARTLAQEGHTALRNGDYAMATDRFSRAVSLVHAPSLLVDLARAQLGMGKLVDAYENYNRIIREGVSPGAPASWVKALADAKAEVAAIPPRLPWVTITVAGPSEPVVTIDGAPIGAASLGVKRPADPGQHEIRASGAGFLPATKTIALKEGESLAVAIELEEAPPDLEAEPSETLAAEPLSSEEQPAGWRKPAIITAFAVGGAGLLLGGVTGVLAISKRSKLSDDCTNAVCGPAQKPDLDNYRALGTLSTVGFVVAGVGGAAGAVLLFTTPQQEPEGSGHLQWSPFLGLGRAGVKGTF